MQSTQPVTLAVVGAGNRGSVYASWAKAHPDRAKVVAVAEPREYQRTRLAEAHGIPPERTFSHWKDLVAGPKVADAVIVATQDKEHVAPALALADLGYHLMIEKPLAPSEQDCRTIIEAVERAGVMLAVCHVLRSTPYTQLLKRVLDEGRIGEIVNVQHLEPVGYWHQAHSYVRGNWRREDQSSPALLAKSCHDIDWLRYVVGAPIEEVSSFGSLKHFKAENAPANSADRCLDCAVEPDCPYSAKRLYLRAVQSGYTGWPLHVVTDDLTEAGVTKALREGPYGRCVYRCDNDVVDHQVVALRFGGDVAATFTMTAFTQAGHRQTQIFGTHGRVDCDGETVTVHDFRTEELDTLTVESSGMDAASGHGGGDAGLMDAFTRALATGDRRHILSGPAESLETHLAVFASERARHGRTVERVG
ncbi:Gfo/Idh/MocA family protein [Tenggerimyces flavus]|uniref:Gfo/Idh/MocA family protein n=1 Tax=Tenggerimyces flavus TaxID=1708749 RepID=A0ABV7Y8N5_9ACTN|nr:Gfo/Idh/MocA family oxidoreductase [Tenggerimyces flavus]MBM7785373.1 putative dehydrogenase [Tenggerimyces flavus]